MPTTTTNFGWTVPADTDLVKDGAAAIRTALGGPDTSFVDLKGGTTGQLLAKATATDLDFTWTTVASGYTPQLTLLNAGGTSLSGSTTTISSISGKQWLYVFVDGASTNTASASTIGIQLNTDTGSNYLQAGMEDLSGGVQSFNTTTTLFRLGMTAAAAGAVTGYANIWNCNTTTVKPFSAAGAASGSGYRGYTSAGHYTGASAVSSVSITCSAGSFDAGTVYVYGA